MNKIAFVCNDAYPLYIYRLGVMRRLIRNYQIYCISSFDGRVSDLKHEGFEFIKVDIDKGINPLRNIQILFYLYRIYKKEGFSIVFHYSIKPCIYGSIAARLAGINSISVITGLGYVFSKNNWLSFLVKFLYKIALISTKKVFFLNDDDRALFIKNKLVQPDKVFVLPSEGINTAFYTPMKLSEITGKPFVFLFGGRFLWDKGIGELIEAFKLTKKSYPQVELWLLGMIDKGNPGRIPENIIRLWEQNNIIKYLGQTNDVRPFIAQCDVVVYPSYYQEGIPRFLLEAMSMEKPIITTNSVGCKEVVENGRTGIMVEPKNVNSLANAMKHIIILSEQERAAMGKNGREKAIRDFAEERVIDIYLKAVHEIMN